MAEDEGGQSFPLENDDEAVYVSPTPNDVLLGRGHGVHDFTGNIIFRRLVFERKQAYNTARMNRVKKKVAKELFDCIHANGGRFLKQVESKKRSFDAVHEGVWFEVEDEVALEKCKQALREKPSPSSDGNEDRKSIKHRATAFIQSFQNHGSVPDREAPSPLEATNTSGVAAAPTNVSTSAEEATDFLTFCAKASDQPFFSDEQAAMERATLTEEEKIDALSDMYGRKCTISTHQSKRSKKVLDVGSVEFLVNQMRVELEAVPENKKRALLEAQGKCHAEEFSDTRLEQFLRCEGMNAQLASQRFVNYWERRRELFGPEKYVLRMTLNGALRDDLIALQTGMFCTLPLRDSSGRHLFFGEPCRHTMKGYSSKSMVRAVWYLVEVMSRDDPTSSDMVGIRWDKHTRISNHDTYVLGRMALYQRTCWPLRLAAMHLCCSPWYVIRIFKPIVQAFMDRRSRSRVQIHDASESQILVVLSRYGILPHMLPTEMGGSVTLNQSEWIARRRAAEETEEIKND